MIPRIKRALIASGSPLVVLAACAGPSATSGAPPSPIIQAPRAEETVASARLSPYRKARRAPGSPMFQSILYSSTLRRGVRFEHDPGVVEIRDRELNPVTSEWEEGVWRYSTPLSVRAIQQRDSNEIFVHGTLEGMDVFERWELEEQVGGRFRTIDLDLRPIGVPDPVYGAPGGESGITGGVYIPIAERPPTRSVTRSTVYWAPTDPRAPRNAFWADPEGRFLHWISGDKLWRLDLPTTAQSVPVMDVDLSGILAGDGLYSLAKLQHVSEGRGYCIGLESYRWLVILDTDNDGITDRAEVLTEAEYSVQFPHGVWIDDFSSFD